MERGAGTAVADYDVAAGARDEVEHTHARMHTHTKQGEGVYICRQDGHQPAWSPIMAYCSKHMHSNPIALKYRRW